MSTTPAQRKAEKIRIVCISDTHGHATGEGFKLPAGDILIHAGDLTNQGGLQELQKAARWLEKADFKHKLVIAGNHDLSLDVNYRLKHADGWSVEPANTEACRELIQNIPGVTYLEHEVCTLEVKGQSVRCFGSPYSLDSGKQNWAFQYTQSDANDLWSSVPADVDILVTHTPPRGILDASTHWTDGGCAALLQRLDAVRPLLHVFGHHHEGRGACEVKWSTQPEESHDLLPWTDPGAGNGKQSLLDATRISLESEPSRKYTAAVNASIMKRSWSKCTAKEFNKPVVVDIRTDAFACD